MTGRVPPPIVRAWMHGHPAENQKFAARYAYEEREQAAVEWAATLSEAEMMRYRGIGRVTAERVSRLANQRLSARLERMAAGYYG